MEDKKKLLVLVGPPSVGKSTWIKNNFPNAYIINRDDIVERVAQSYGWTYDDLYELPSDSSKLGDYNEKYGTVIQAPEWMTWAKFVFDKVSQANMDVKDELTKTLSNARPSGKDIVVDMTNMNAQFRKDALKIIEGYEDDYIKIAVDFKFKGAESIIKKVAHKRAEEQKKLGKSKTIPDSSFDRMFMSYEEPSKSEGFDEIISVDNISKLKDSIGQIDEIRKIVRNIIKEFF